PARRPGRAASRCRRRRPRRGARRAGAGRRRERQLRRRAWPQPRDQRHTRPALGRHRPARPRQGPPVARFHAGNGRALGHGTAFINMKETGRTPMKPVHLLLAAFLAIGCGSSKTPPTGGGGSGGTGGGGTGGSGGGTGSSWLTGASATLLSTDDGDHFVTRSA